MTPIPKPVHDFLETVEKLFGDAGCPWLKELDVEMLQRTLNEEVHEVSAACSFHDWPGLADELGDLLFNILCLSKVYEKLGHGSWTDPFLKATEKFQRRNPHVFLPGRSLKTAKEVEIQWLKIKAEERAAKGKHEKDFDRAVRDLPTLPLFLKVLERMKHAPHIKKRLEKLLDQPSSSQEETLAKEFLRLTSQAYDNNVSLEIEGKRLMKKWLPHLEIE